MKEQSETPGLTEGEAQPDNVDNSAEPIKAAVPPAIAELLGLGEASSLSEITGTIMAMKQAAERGNEADSLMSELAALKSQATKRDAEDLVEAAMKEGKVSPAQRDWARGYAEREPEGFRVFVAKAPVVVQMGEATPPSPLRLRGEIGGLDAAQAQVNIALAIGEKTYRKHNG